MCTVCVSVCECVSVSVLCVIYFMAHAVHIILCVGCWVFRVMLFCNSFFGLNLKELCRNISVELYKIQRIKTVSSFWNVIDTFLSQCFRKSLPQSLLHHGPFIDLLMMHKEPPGGNRAIATMQRSGGCWSHKQPCVILLSCFSPSVMPSHHNVIGFS